MANGIVHFGIAPINWNNDDMPELGANYTIEMILSEMSQAGYVGTEIGNKYPKDAIELKNILESNGLDLASSWHSTFFVSNDLDSEMQKLEKKISMLRIVGANVVNIAECTSSIHSSIHTPLSQKPILSDKDWSHLMVSLQKAGEVCHSNDIQMAYHHHMGTCVQTIEEIKTLLDDTDPVLVNLCADTGHLKFAGIDPAEFFKEYMDRIKHVHFKDIRVDVFNDLIPEKDSFLRSVLKGVFTVPGDGCLDFVTISEILKGSNYEGWIIVEAEQDPRKADPLDHAIRSHDYLKNIWVE